MTLFHLLLALAAVAIAGRLMGRALAWIGQPPVIGEVLAGICLGPSLLGRIAPDAYAFILPASIAPLLGAVAQVGVILYMLLVGLGLHASHLREHIRKALAISQASIVIPFALGAVLALYLYPRVGTAGVPLTSFALFMGVAMCITAFPVLARILTDRGMARTELGVIALTCAAASDIIACALLAIVVAVSGSAVGGALLSGLLKGGLTVHASLVAFFVGVAIPHNGQLARLTTEKLERPVTILLLPAFFAFTGMRTQIGSVTGGTALAITALIILVATMGKFGGTLVAARLTGMDWRHAASLGILMNTRGLMELIVLNIGLDLGVISPQLFTMMVLMAIVTTIATTPVLQWLHPVLQPLPLTARHRAAEGA